MTSETSRAPSLSGRRVLVTGASRGIGAAVVTAMSANGAAVACCARDIDALRDLAARAPGPGKVQPFQADLSKFDQVDRFVEEAREALGGVDVLVTNAGQVSLRNFLETDEEDWAQTIRLNLLSAVRTVRRVVPTMLDQQWGRIIMVASSGAKYPEAAWIDYAASKAGVVTTAVALAREYAARNVLVNAVLPGVIDTPMWEGSAQAIAAVQGGTAADVKSAVQSTLPMKRFGRPEEIAEFIVFLASDRASYLSGAAIDVDGALASHVF